MNKPSIPVIGAKGYDNPLKRFVIVLIPLLFVLTVGSCGKKGSPMPPKMLPLPAVSDLEIKTTPDNVVELTWTMPLIKNAPIADGFWVYRSKKPLKDPECPECPYEFKKISELLSDFKLRGGKDARFDYRDNVETGFAYRYKVMAFTRIGLTSDWSNLVEVEIK